jgi:hypothetical protein
MRHSTAASQRRRPDDWSRQGMQRRSMRGGKRTNQRTRHCKCSVWARGHGLGEAKSALDTAIRIYIKPAAAAFPMIGPARPISRSTPRCGGLCTETRCNNDCRRPVCMSVPDYKRPIARRGGNHSGGRIDSPPPRRNHAHTTRTSREGRRPHAARGRYRNRQGSHSSSPLATAVSPSWLGLPRALQKRPQSSILQSRKSSARPVTPDSLARTNRRSAMTRSHSKEPLCYRFSTGRCQRNFFRASCAQA